MAAVGDRVIHGHGTDERAWQAAALDQRLGSITLDELVPPATRAVIVAPHPDDEVLGSGGLLQLLGAAGREAVVVSVSDGSGSHPGSSRWPVDRLRAVRRRESREALRRIGAERARHVWLGLPDGGLSQCESRIVDALLRVLVPTDRVFVTWRLDGHPDHEACGRAAAQACDDSGAMLIEIPIWTWHWAHPEDRRVPWSRMRRLALPAAALQAKRRAIDAHRSQLEPDPTTGRDAILPAHVIERLLRPWEAVIL